MKDRGEERGEIERSREIKRNRCREGERKPESEGEREGNYLKQYKH